MKKKFLLLSGCGLLGAAAIAVGAMNGESVTNLFKVGATEKCTVCSGHHHAAKTWFNKTKTNDGHYEYWRCCQCHNFYLSTNEIPGYDATKWVDKADDTDCPFDYTDYTDRRIQFGGLLTTHNVNKLADGTTITIDGQRDAAYDNAVKENFSAAMHGNSQVTATLETLWQGEMLYVYVDVYDPTKYTRDFTTANTNVYTEANDAVELCIDTLHSAQYAADNWDGKAGVSYRGSYGCEGRFKVAAGYQRSDQWGDGIGCEFFWDYYMSNLARGDNKTYVKSYYKDDTHYGVEFGIRLNNSAFIMNPFHEIGMAVKIYDKNTSGGQDGIINFEQVGDDMNYLRCYSNFRLIGYGE